MDNIFKDIEDMQKHIQPLDVNGLKGRMLKLPSRRIKGKNKEILLVYGHHASLERVYGIAEVASQFGRVTVPDLPGFGGMDSFHKIGMKPTLDNMADYLATFVKLRYKRKKVIIIGMSMGFVIATRMLQRYPDLVGKVEIIVSLVGFTHEGDYKFSRTRLKMFRGLCRVVRTRVISTLFYNIALHPSVIRSMYSKGENAKIKFKGLTPDQKKAALDFEVILWRSNDVRTHWHTALELTSLDNCDRLIKLPVHHVSVAGDRYFDNAVVEQHMRVVFTDFTEHEAIMDNHAPSILASAKEADPLIPQSIKELMR